MIYDKRNRENLNKLADNTKIKALQWYEYCVKNGYEVLIYETIRTVEKQRENVKKGVSKTMQSYHLVGQALDFVLIDSKGNELWKGYHSTIADRVINYAKSLGFESGRDWGWDAPHLQYRYKGYGTDTFGKKPNVDYSKQLGYNVAVDSRAFRIHTGKYSSKAIALAQLTVLTSKRLLGYGEVFGDDKTGYRIQSGKYNSQKDCEAVAIRLLQGKYISYASIIGTKE